MKQKSIRTVIIILGMIIILSSMVACGKAGNHTVKIPNNFFTGIVHETPQEYMDVWKKDAEKTGNYDINGFLSYNLDEEYTTIELSDAQLSETLKSQEEFLKQYQEEFSREDMYRIEYDKDYKNIKYYCSCHPELTAS